MKIPPSIRGCINRLQSEPAQFNTCSRDKEYYKVYQYRYRTGAELQLIVKYGPNLTIRQNGANSSIPKDFISGKSLFTMIPDVSSCSRLQQMLSHSFADPLGVLFWCEWILLF